MNIFYRPNQKTFNCGCDLVIPSGIIINTSFSLITGVSPASRPVRISDAHKRIIVLNHPDRGGSPYLATKINEAKDHLMKGNN